MEGYAVYNKTFTPNDVQGGKRQYNKIPFDRTVVNQNLPAGIYYAVLMDDATRKPIGKLKMALVP